MRELGSSAETELDSPGFYPHPLSQLLLSDDGALLQDAYPCAICGLRGEYRRG